MKVEIAREIKALNDRIDNLEKLVSDLTILNKDELEDCISVPTVTLQKGQSERYITVNHSPVSPLFKPLSMQY